MKKIFVIIQVMLVFQHTSAQVWFPLEVGNKWQYIENTGRFFLGVVNSNYTLREYSILDDSVVNNNLYHIWSKYPSDLIRYNSPLYSLFFRTGDSDTLYRYFPFPNDTTISLFNPDGGNNISFELSTDSVTYGDSTLTAQKFYFEWYHSYNLNGEITELYCQDIGLRSYEWSDYAFGDYNWKNLTLIQANISGTNISENVFPEILAEPVTITNNFWLIDTILVKHKYTKIVTDPSVGQGLNFLNSILILGQYSKGDSIIENAPVLAYNISRTEKWRVNSPLDQELLNGGFNFKYRIKAVDKGLVPHITFLPDSGYFTAIIDTVTNINDEIHNADFFILSQNYPNPFNPSTKIQYAITSRQLVILKVFDVLGKEVATLVNEEKPAGSYDVKFDAAHLPSGVYFYQLRLGDYVDSKKMLLMK